MLFFLQFFIRIFFLISFYFICFTIFACYVWQTRVSTNKSSTLKVFAFLIKEKKGRRRNSMLALFYQIDFWLLSVLKLSTHLFRIVLLILFFSVILQLFIKLFLGLKLEFYSLVLKLNSVLPVFIFKPKTLNFLNANKFSIVLPSISQHKMRFNISLCSTYFIQWCFKNRLKIEKKQLSFRNKFIDMCINEILWHTMNCYSSLSHRSVF